MKQINAVFILVFLLAAIALGQTVPVSYDQYGGINEKPSKFGTSNDFRVEKFGPHWMLVTPAGHAFFMKGVFAVAVDTHTDALGSDYKTRILAKYGNLTNWALYTNKRLKGWGFNALGEYSMAYNINSAEKMPSVLMFRPSLYGMKPNTTGAQPMKDLVAGVAATYKGYRGGTTPDVFDPNFAIYCDKSFAGAVNVVGNPYILGIAVDDSDNLNGFGPGPDVPTGHTHTHIGYLTLVTNPQQAANTKLGVASYVDHKVYSKYALRDFLATKYGTVTALNTSWGAAYTTFDTSGGYGSGTGLLDEDGRHTHYLGTDATLTTIVNPNVKADLDGFLAQYASQYFSVISAAAKKYAPKKLLMGPATLNGWGGVSRKEVLQAAGKYLDIIQASVNTQHGADLTAAAAGDKPLITWRGMSANADSSLWRSPGGVATQVIRAQVYDAAISSDFNTTITATGNQPVVGFKFWALVDSVGEKVDWGLETTSENAYDGVEARIAPSIDVYGFARGGEEHDYGDFLHPISVTNQNLDKSVVLLPSGVPCN